MLYGLKLFSQSIYIMRSLPSCVNVYGFRVPILELSNSVKRKNHVFVYLNFKICHQISNAILLKEILGLILTQFTTLVTMTITHSTLVCSRCILISYFNSLLIDLTTGMSL